MKNLLKKDVKWVWIMDCQASFDNLKGPIATEHMLKFLYSNLPFEMHTESSDRDISGMLVQKNQQIAFESRKLNEEKEHYSTHEK